MFQLHRQKLPTPPSRPRTQERPLHIATCGNPETGAPARDPALYREVVARIRDSGTDIVINLTAGMGGDLVIGNPESPLPPAQDGTDLVGVSERLRHVQDLLPEICTLDCGIHEFRRG